jgi:hypothetical protein
MSRRYPPRQLKTVRLRLRWNTAKLDREINREILKQEKRGYMFIGQEADRGFLYLRFAVPARATSRVMR